MGYTLAQATLDLARLITDVIENTASANSGAGVTKTSLTDTNIPRSIPGADYFNQGCLWLINQVTGTGNEGDTVVVTDWVNTTSTFSFASLTNSVMSGDSYAATTGDWPRDVLRRAINMALQEIGNIDRQDTSLTTVADQQQYTLPTASTSSNADDVHGIKKMEIAASTTSPYDYYRYDRSRWYELGAYLFFRPGYEPGSTGYKIRLTYNIKADELTTDAATLPDIYHPDLVKWTAAVHALRWQHQRKGEDDKVVMRLLQEAMAQKEIMWRRYIPIITRMPRENEGSIWSTPTGKAGEDFTVDVVRL
jgi:hypothetical protein